MSFAATIQGVPLARAFTTSSLSKPRSAQSARRAPLIVRAKDPAAPDKAEVKGEVIDCKSSVLCLASLSAASRFDAPMLPCIVGCPRLCSRRLLHDNCCSRSVCYISGCAPLLLSTVCAGRDQVFLHAAVAKELPGISQPFPNIFDPLNFLGSAGSSNNPIRDVRRWRESELTHGRVCMLAALGFIVQEQLIDTKIRPFPFVKGTCIQFASSLQCFGSALA